MPKGERVYDLRVVSCLGQLNFVYFVCFGLLWFVLVRLSIIWCKTYAVYRTVVSLFYLVLITYAPVYLD